MATPHLALLVVVGWALHGLVSDGDALVHDRNDYAGEPGRAAARVGMCLHEIAQALNALEPGILPTATDWGALQLGADRSLPSASINSSHRWTRVSRRRTE